MNIALLAGDYIGPEVMRATVAVLERLARLYALDMRFAAADVGGGAIDAHGTALPRRTIEICGRSDAVLFGSVGGPKWEGLPPEQQPERAALLPLRKQFGLFANVRPTIVFPMLRQSSPLALRGDDGNHTEGGNGGGDRNESGIAGGDTENGDPSIDFVIVRELTGGIYFAEPKEIGADFAYDTLRYQREEVVRIARAAFEIAKTRKRKKVTSIDKANVLHSMVFWRKIVGAVAEEYPEVAIEHLYVDNAAMQLILRPQQFEVLLCPNMFGDILSDEAAALAGSLGLQPSASLGNPRERENGNASAGGGSGSAGGSAGSGYFGLYEPAGGSAPDIAGKDIANPIAQILSAALMFQYSFGRADLYRALWNAVQRVLTDGARTADIAAPGDTAIGTTEMSERIAEALQ